MILLSEFSGRHNVAGGCEYATPLANIAEAALLLRSLPRSQQKEEILKFTHRAYVLLDQQNLILSIPLTNSRASQQGSSGCHLYQPQGSCTRGAIAGAGGGVVGPGGRGVVLVELEVALAVILDHLEANPQGAEATTEQPPINSGRPPATNQLRPR
jgi:hypothetical protein